MNDGEQMYELCSKIYPVYRHLMGDGIRTTLEMLNEFIIDTGFQLHLTEVKTGKLVSDWRIPKEWVIREGYIEDEEGNHIVDVKDNNLHIVGYSTPIDKWLELKDIMEYIYTQPEQPDVIPYVTSYYRENTGFCMSENMRKNLKQGKYHLFIDSEFQTGSLTYADLIMPGRCEQEVMICTYICHPSMANDNCSGLALLASLIKYIADIPNRKYTYRFVVQPETIGAIAYITDHREALKKVIAAFNLSCVGDNNCYSLIESPYADTYADKIMKNLLKNRENVIYYSYLDRGSDERQYAAPGVDVPMVCFCRSKFGCFPEYHTSADNMSFVSSDGFQGSYDLMTEAIQVIEHNAKYKAKILCEPQLSRRGLQASISQKGKYDEVLKLRNVISYADGRNDLISLGEILKESAYDLINRVKVLEENGLIEKSE